MTNPHRGEIVQVRLVQDPVGALEALVIALAHRWRQIHPVAQALHAAAVTDADARTAWDDRMLAVLKLARHVTDLLASHRLLATGWSSAAAADWLWSVVHPLTWVQLVAERGWSQHQYERRLVQVTRDVLVRASGPEPRSTSRPSRRGRR